VTKLSARELTSAIARLADATGENPVASDTGSAVDMSRTAEHRAMDVKKEMAAILRSAVPTEYDEQAAIFQWANNHTNPHVGMLYANANGQYRPGQRAEPGLKSGVPDMFLPVPRGGFHGLYIELKRKKGSVTSNAQKKWLRALTERGYAAVICYGAEQAKATIEKYVLGEAII